MSVHEATPRPPRSRRWVRAWLVPVVIAGTLTAGAAGAAPRRPAPPPKPVCRLIVDAANDDAAWASPLGYYDIVSADLATDPRIETLSATVRVRNLDLLLANGTNDTQVYWTVSFRVPNSKYLFGIETHAFTTLPGTGTFSSLFAFSPTGERVKISDGRAVWDLNADELRMRVVLTDVKAKTGVTLRPKQQLTTLSARSDLRAINTIVTAAYGTADTASSTAKYALGAPSCIKPEAGFQ